MVELLDEVKDDLQREWWLNFWRRVGGYFVAGSVAIILATVVTVSWQKMQKEKRISATSGFLKAESAAQIGQKEEAIALFAETAADAPDSMPTLARLKQAGVLLSEEKLEESAAVLKSVVDDASVDQGLRDLASLRLATVYNSLGKDYATLESVLAPVANNAKSSFSSLAKEQLAISALDEGKPAEAWKMLMEVKLSDDAPDTQRVRVENMLSTLEAPAAAMEAPAAVTKDSEE